MLSGHLRIRWASYGAILLSTLRRKNRQLLAEAVCRKHSAHELQCMRRATERAPLAFVLGRDPGDSCSDAGCGSRLCGLVEVRAVDGGRDLDDLCGAAYRIATRRARGSLGPSSIRSADVQRCLTGSCRGPAGNVIRRGGRLDLTLVLGGDKSNRRPVHATAGIQSAAWMPGRNRFSASRASDTAWGSIAASISSHHEGWL